MRAWMASAVILAAAVPGCRKRETIPHDPEAARGLPREVAVRELGARLPTAEAVACALPKASLKPSEIQEWKVGAEEVEIVPRKEKPLRFSYAELTQARLERAGRAFVVKLFTAAVKDREHFAFTWRIQETAQQVVDLIESLRQKP